MADNKRYILTEKQIDAYSKWYVDNIKWRTISLPETYKNWLAKNPCPLPLPVEVPSDEEIDIMAKGHFSSNAHRFGYITGAKQLLKLIFNKQ